jgi:hypothetical protein
LRSRADLYSALEDDPAALESARKDLTDLLEHEPRWAPGQLELVSTELALAEKTIAQVASERKALATNAETAVEKLFGMEGIMPASWLTRAKAIEKLSQPDRRQTDAVLNIVTGPMAPRAFTLRARAHALSDDMRDAARHLVTWPGAPACTLRWIAKELESSDERHWIREARSRAAKKERRMTAMERDLVAELRRRARKAGQRTRRPSGRRKPADAQTSRTTR